MEIGSKIKELRILYGLTQQELADRLELSKGFISQLERNLTSPSVGTLLDIIQCLGTTPAEFFADDEPEQIVFKKEDYFTTKGSKEVEVENTKNPIYTSSITGNAQVTAYWVSAFCRKEFLPRRFGAR